MQLPLYILIRFYFQSTGTPNLNAHQRTKKSDTYSFCGIYYNYIISPHMVDRHCASGNIHSTDTGLQCELPLIQHNGAGAVLSLPNQSAV